MTGGLSGSVPDDLDLGQLAPGERLTIVLDGWRGEKLDLRVVTVKPFLAHWLDRAWVLGIDSTSQRLRTVLVRADLPVL